MCYICYHCIAFQQVQLVKQFCSPKVRAVVDQYVTRNSYFANPKLMLLTLLGSENEQERRFGVKVIREQIRKGADVGDSLPRKFETPAVNFDATSLQSLIDWNKAKLSELLLTATMSTDEVIACLDTPWISPAPGVATARPWKEL